MNAKLLDKLCQLDAKWMSLTFFIVLNSALMIALRYCTIYSDPSTPYISTTAVLFAEFIKLFLSLIICLIFDANGDSRSLLNVLYRGFIEEKNDCLKVAIPAILYTIQNNLQYVIETAPLFQMLYQLKLLSTAVFYTTLLSQRLTLREWMAILALMIGVSMVQSSQTDIQQHHATLLVGVESVVIACFISGLAGVSFEKIVKSSKSSIWLVNIQLSLMCTGMALLTCWFEGFRDLEKDGSFVRGYNKYVVIVILLQSITGLVSSSHIKQDKKILLRFFVSDVLYFLFTLYLYL